MPVRPFPLALLAGLAAPPASALEPLEPITVTAMPLSHEVDEIAGPVDVLSGSELRYQRRGTLGETLARQPGVSASDFGQGSSRPVIRGLAGARLRMLEDGIGSMDASSVSVDHAVTIEPLDASQIEVLRGPATLLYGSGAIGGVVNVVTGRIPTRIPPALSGLFDLRLDSVNGGGTGRYLFEGGGEQFAARVSGLVREAGDYTPGGTSKALDNSDVQSRQFSGGLSWIGDSGMLGLGLSQFRTDYGIPGGKAVRIQLEQMRQDLEGRVDNPLPGLEQVKLRVGRNDYQHQEIEPDGEVATLFTNKEVEGRVEVLHRPLGAWRGLVGIQGKARDFSASGEEAYVPPVKRYDIGLFALEERDFGPVHVEAGARVEHAWNEATGGNVDVDHTVYSLSGGAVWRFTPGYSLGASLSRAQRAPDIEELYSDGPHLATGAYEIGNAGLSSETANNLDLSLRKLEGRWTFTLSLYGNRYEDYIYLDTVDAGGVPQRVDEEGVPDPNGELLLLNAVQADAWFYGLEFESGFALSRGPAGEFDLNLMADYVRGQLDGGVNLPRIPPLRIGGGLDWRRGPWSARVSALGVMAQNDDAPLEGSTPGFTMLDLGVDYTLGSDFGVAVLSLRAENLLDEEARRHASFLKNVALLPGRNFGLDLRLTF